MNQRLGAKLAAIVTLIMLLALPSLAANDRALHIAAGDVASGLFKLADALAKTVTGPETTYKCQTGQVCADLGLRADAQTSVSAEAALSKLRAGAVDAVVVPDTLAFGAYQGGTARRLSAWPQLRALANVDVQPVIILTRGDLKVTAVEGMSGWRIATGPRGSDANTAITSLLTALGLASNQYQGIAADMDASALELIKNNKVDAVIMLADTLPAPERAALAAGTLKLFNLTKGDLERAITTYPFINRRVVNIGLGDSYTTLCIGTVLLTRVDLPAPVVQTILSRLWLKVDTNPLFDIAHAATNLPVPLHSAAASFYQGNKLTETSRGSTTP